MTPVWSASELATVRTLSDALVDAQRPILILNSVKWSDEVERDFYAHGAGRQPAVDRDYYAQHAPLRFDAADKRAELDALRGRVTNELGSSPVGELLVGRIGDYSRVVDMLEARGTARFGEVSAELYGAADDRLHDAGPTLSELGDQLDGALENISNSAWEADEGAEYSAAEGVEVLAERLGHVCGAGRVRVKIDDGIVADAAAGSDYIKLREGATFSERSLRVLEVHEGWVHVATGLNGRDQPWCTFLAKGTPSTTVTQEGLAVFTEITTLSSTPNRLRTITRRMQAIAMAHEGATFLDVYRWMLDEGLDAEDAWSSTHRVFRGSTPTLAPFTKDLVYSRGFLEVYNVMRLAVQRGLLDRLPLMFVGKIAVRELGALAALRDQGLITDPPVLPPSISDVTALASWMAFSNLLNRVDGEAMEIELAAALS